MYHVWKRILKTGLKVHKIVNFPIVFDDLKYQPLFYRYLLTCIFFQSYARQGIDVSISWGESRLQSKLNFNIFISVIFNLNNNVVLLSIMYWLDLKQKFTRYLIYYYCFSSTFLCLILLIIYCECIYLKLYLIYVNFNN